MKDATISNLCKSTVISKITYVAPSWWSFANIEQKLKLQAIINKCIKWGFYSKKDPTLNEIIDKNEECLFNKILSNPHHILHQFLPPQIDHKYQTRKRRHNLQLPVKQNTLNSKNFMCRLLYKDCF